MSEEFDKEFWQDVHRDHHAVDHGPNPQLVAESADLAPGAALDAGCGAGADARWLAGHGWRVTAVDFSEAALHQARERAASLDAAVAERIDWVEADLTSWTPPAEAFDLVSAQYVHLTTAAAREDLYRRLAAAVAPGGTLLIAGHQTPTRHSGDPSELYLDAAALAAGFDSDQWDVLAETRAPRAADADDHEHFEGDAVLKARRRS
jgi:SAM-dependent methyltransferase